MAVFLGIHKFPESFSEAQMQETWGKYQEACRQRGLRPMRVHYNGEKAMAFCETEGPSAESVMAAHEAVGKIPQELIEIKTLGQPFGR